MSFYDYKDAIDKLCLDDVEYQKFSDAFAKHKNIIILGNGGSNAVASHISQDYVKFHNKNSKCFSDPSMLTCFINDFGMRRAYVKFLEAYCDNDTLVILISSSGESKNIINCLKWCEASGISYGVLTGFNNENKLRTSAKNALFNYHVDSDKYGVVECTHQIFLHGVI